MYHTKCLSLPSLKYSFCYFVSSASLSENMVVNGTSHEIIRPVPRRFAVGSAGASRHEIPGHSRPQRTLINPFKPNEIPCNWTCNRHRWSHVFPKGPGGEVLHRHYEKLSPAESNPQIKTDKVGFFSILQLPEVYNM